jgi:hypothetical protein
VTEDVAEVGDSVAVAVNVDIVADVAAVDDVS